MFYYITILVTGIDMFDVLNTNLQRELKQFQGPEAILEMSAFEIKNILLIRNLNLIFNKNTGKIFLFLRDNEFTVKTRKWSDAYIEKVEFNYKIFLF